MPVTNYHTLNGRIRGETTSGIRTNYLTDALGSITATVNSSAAVVNTYRHKPYGKQLAKTGAGADPKYQWTGDTGSRKTGRIYAEQYNEQRHLGTTQGQWTTVDLLWPREAAYSFALLNPISFIDPNGQSVCPIGDDCNPNLGIWPKCDDWPRIIKCYNDSIPADRCPGGTWVKCPVPGEFKRDCKGDKANCDAIAGQIGYIDDVVTGRRGSDVGKGHTWDAATGCCVKAGGWGSQTVCCSTGSLIVPSPNRPKTTPCVAYCILAAHEAFGHGSQCAARSPDIGVGPGGDRNEKSALMCERACLMQAWEKLGCASHGGPSPPPTPRWQGAPAYACPQDPIRWF